MPAEKVVDPALVSGLRRRYEAGESFSDIAAGIGWSKSTVRKYLLAAGVAPDRSRSISLKKRGKPGHRRGAKHTPEARAKMSASLKGRPPGRTGPHSAETKAKISEKRRSRPPCVRKRAPRVGRYTAEELRNRERVRASYKRFLRRVLNAKGSRKCMPSQLYLGYSTAELIDHLGPRPSNAHIDHYVPVAEFFRRGITDPAIVNALPNLRWLDAVENRRKSAKVPHDADAVIAVCVRTSSPRQSTT